MARRAKGEGSIRKRSDGRWEGRYTVGTDYATGKRINKSVFGKTQAEARQKLQTAIRENRGPAINFKGDYTVGEWMWLWFETYSKPHLRPSTENGYRNYIGHHIEPGLGRIKLKQLTSLQIQQFYNRSKESGRVQRWEHQKDPGLSNRMVRGIHMVLRQALQQAVDERIINHNPCDHVRIPKLEKKEMKIIPPEKLGDYLQKAKEFGVLPIFYLELTSGLRRGELLALHWSDLDVKNCTVSVSKTVGRVNGELLISPPKTANSMRTVVIPQQAVELLVEDRANHPDSKYLFPSPRTGDMWSPESIARMHKKILKAAGIDESVRFHDLRHTFATVALQNGVDVKTVASMLGHYSAGFTLDTYTHVTADMQKAAASKMAGVMNGAMSPEPEPTPPEPTTVGGCKIIPFERVG